MSRTNKFYLLNLFISPLLLIYLQRDTMSLSDYIFPSIVLCAEMVCIWVFYANRLKWQEWLMDRKSHLNIDPKFDPVAEAINILYLLIFIVFVVLIPFGVYLNYPMGGIEIMGTLNLAVWVWFSLFRTPLYEILTGDREEQDILWRTPYLSLFFILAIKLFFQNPFDATATTLIILILFCTDMALLLVVRARLIKRKIEQ